MSIHLPENKLATVWEEELYLKLRHDRKIAYLFAIAAMILALGMLVLLALTPPKEIHIPYVFTVDTQTGHVIQQSTVEHTGIKDLEAVTKSNIARFIILRETYDPIDVVRNYHLVRLHTAETALSDFDKLWRSGNPENPSEQYGYNVRIHTKVINVILINNNTAQVRFQTQIKPKNGQDKEVNWSGILTYRYVSTPLKQQDLYQNPLGFQVTSYRREQDSL